MSLEQKYVNHLRQSARSPEQYVCVICKHRTLITGKQAFRTHLDSVHSDEVERSSKEPDFDLERWKETIENRSKETRLVYSPSLW
jgi:hypothetical protein